MCHTPVTLIKSTYLLTYSRNRNLSKKNSNRNLIHGKYNAACIGFKRRKKKVVENKQLRKVGQRVEDNLRAFKIDGQGIRVNVKPFLGEISFLYVKQCRKDL